MKFGMEKSGRKICIIKNYYIYNDDIKLENKKMK